jgi:hypothetical protein
MQECVDHGHIHLIVRGCLSDGMKDTSVVLAAGSFVEGKGAAARNVHLLCLDF